MVLAQSSSQTFGWRATYELQRFQDGHWVISAVFDDRRAALAEAHRVDRSGKLVRLRADEVHASGKSRGTRTVFLSSTIKRTWQAERERIALRGARPTRWGREDEEPQEGRSINPYFLLAIFTVVAFSGLGAILALRTLYAAI